MKRIIIAAVASIFMLFSAGLFFPSYGEWQAEEKKIGILKIQQRMLRQNRQEMEQKFRQRNRAARFMAKARNTGLSINNWERYEVNIDKQVYFSGLFQILNQCVTTNVYYFRPQSLRIQIPSALESKQNRPVKPAGSSADDPMKDARVTLTGTFIARQS